LLKEAAMMKSIVTASFALLATLGVALAEGPKVSRLPGVPDQSPDIAKGKNAGGEDVINLTITRGHAPKIAAAQGSVARALRNDLTTPRVLRELTIMRTAILIKADYEINQHIPMIKACGYTDAKVAAIRSWSNSKLFDERERVLLGFVDQMVQGGDVDDATFADFSARFTPEEIVEIAATVSTYVSTGLYVKAIKLEIEKDGRQAFMGKC
jgi:alkylhydroperoxidase family enzyme